MWRTYYSHRPHLCLGSYALRGTLPTQYSCPQCWGWNPLIYSGQVHHHRVSSAVLIPYFLMPEQR